MFPRYHYTLDGKYFDLKNRYYIYRLKVFADYSFLKENASVIKNNKNLKNFINPDDLITIIENETLHEVEKNKFYILESLRNNLYKIGNHENEEFLSDQEISAMPELIQKIKPLDAFKIAYETGFKEGREFSISLNKKIQEENLQENKRPKAKIHVLNFKE